jgi:mannose-6-phosphate isomerase
MADLRSSKPPEIAPFRIEPVFTARVWGFRDLRPWYDRVAEGDPIGEVWLTGDDCRVATGPHAGKRLGALFSEERAALLGPNAPSPDSPSPTAPRPDAPGSDSPFPPGADSPLLIKTIFAREKLSVQVHPDDKMAQKYGLPRGKTECWYALQAEPGAEVAVGVKPGTTLAEIEEGIRAGTLETRLNMLPVAAGDTIYVDAGTVHAIWPGSILLETQQNSDTTYRMYDYGRGRELHIAKSLEATKFTTRAGKVAPRELPDRTLLIDVEYFRIERLTVSGNRTSESLRGAGGKRGLEYFFAASGAGRLVGQGPSGADFEPVDLPARGIVAVPAASPEFVLEDATGAGKRLELIRITPNWPATAE